MARSSLLLLMVAAVSARHLRETLALQTSSRTEVMQTKTWAELSQPVTEDTKRVGLEFELNWIMGQFKSKAKDGITQEWGAANGHLAFYTCTGDWENWDVHLDGAVWPEMVMKPVSKQQLKIELRRFKTAFGGITTTHQWKEFVAAREESGEFVKQEGFPDAVYTHFKKFSVQGGAGSRPAGSPQVTSTYTLAEMKHGDHMAKTVYAAFEGATTDKQVRDSLLYKEEFKENAKLSESILIKSVAEQMGPKNSEDVNIDTPPQPKGFPDAGIDKVKVAYHLHTKANKIAPMFKRGGQPAYLVEIRKRNGYQAWFDLLCGWMKQTAKGGPGAPSLDQIANMAFS